MTGTNQAKVELLHYTPLSVSDQAIGQCWNTGCYEGDALAKRMVRVANKNKHKSTIEHIVYNFHISGISRALLQEIARHRIASPTVKSTRYTLKELKNIGPFAEYDFVGASKFIVLTGNDQVDNASIKALNNLQTILKSGVSNDIAKFCLPESYKTELVWTINARSLQNFLELRTASSALWEIQNLAFKVYGELPEDHKFLFSYVLETRAQK